MIEEKNQTQLEFVKYLPDPDEEKIGITAYNAQVKTSIQKIGWRKLEPSTPSSS